MEKEIMLKRNTKHKQKKKPNNPKSRLHDLAEEKYKTMVCKKTKFT